MSKEQTAVDFLVENLKMILPISQINDVVIQDCFKQAKELEKQQIIDAVEFGNRIGYDQHRLTCILDEDEQYYNNKYN